MPFQTCNVFDKPSLSLKLRQECESSTFQRLVCECVG